MYFILFFDPDYKHSTPSRHNYINNNIKFCNSKEHINESLVLCDPVKITICICCKNKHNVLNELQRYSNLASIVICTEHHNDNNEQNSINNYRILTKQNLFENIQQWQIEAHTDAYNANNSQEINIYIQRVLRQLLEQELCQSQDSIEA